MDYYVITYGLMAISLLITLGAQGYINSSYNKYKRVNNRRGISGFEAARKILDENGLKDMYI
ncbi:MAG: zinc metallopeptidase, partial [Bacilli bacterium]|nr:zinc metallopeptidase [Bacilli bacterium]